MFYGIRNIVLGMSTRRHVFCKTILFARIIVAHYKLVIPRWFCQCSLSWSTPFLIPQYYVFKTMNVGSMFSIQTWNIVGWKIKSIVLLQYCMNFIIEFKIHVWFTSHHDCSLTQKYSGPWYSFSTHIIIGVNGIVAMAKHYDCQWQLKIV